MGGCYTGWCAHKTVKRHVGKVVARENYFYTLKCDRRGDQNDSLPPGWELIVGGKDYYCNRSTGETSWDKPIESNGCPGCEEAERTDPQHVRLHNVFVGK